MHLHERRKLWNAHFYHFNMYLCCVAHLTVDCAFGECWREMFLCRHKENRDFNPGKSFFFSVFLVRCWRPPQCGLTMFAGNISSLFLVILRWSLSSFRILNLATFFFMWYAKIYHYEDKYLCDLGCSTRPSHINSTQGQFSR